MRSSLLWASALPVLAFASQGALAQVSTTPSPAAATDPASATSEQTTSPQSGIIVTAKKLDAVRASIQPSLGATSYTITNETIQALPGGDNQQFNQIILQLPGVVQDGFGQFHVRDDHNNLQYRINGVILPEGLAVFGQTLSPRLVNSFNLLTGALPAQYGLRTAGIIDVTTKTGFDNSGSVSMYGGSHGTYEPSVEYGGSSGSTNYFVSADYRRDKLGIESVDGSSTPIHDTTKQVQLFGYVDHIIDDENRISFVGGFSNQQFQIPNPDGLHAADTNPGWDVNGQTDFLSNNLNERQTERTGFGQIAYLHDSGPLSIQGSLFARYSSLKYSPDTLGELLFNGQARIGLRDRLLRVVRILVGVGRQPDFFTRRIVAERFRRSRQQRQNLGQYRQAVPSGLGKIGYILGRLLVFIGMIIIIAVRAWRPFRDAISLDMVDGFLNPVLRVIVTKMGMEDIGCLKRSAEHVDVAVILLVIMGFVLGIFELGGEPVDHLLDRALLVGRQLLGLQSFLLETSVFLDALPKALFFLLVSAAPGVITIVHNRAYPLFFNVPTNRQAVTIVGTLGLTRPSRAYQRDPKSAWSRRRSGADQDVGCGAAR